METAKPIIIVTFYKFVSIAEPSRLQETLKAKGVALGVKGTILLAKEGINATLAGESYAVHQLLTCIREQPEIGEMTCQITRADEMPFKRYFVKVKPEIVAMGVPDIDPQKRRGQYVQPDEWNQLLDDPNVVVLDVRNEYEVHLGKFRGAVNPHTEVFKEFPEYARAQLNTAQHPKIAMYCTGGIRCEKASALLLAQGFSEVYHLQGGILNYLDKIPPEHSRWQGECFVFDDRIAIE